MNWTKTRWLAARCFKTCSSGWEVDARIAVQRADDDDEGDDPHWILNVSGDRVNRLIGRRGETLSSLQHIVRLICSRRLERRANIIVDAGGYKSGRSKRIARFGESHGETSRAAGPDHYARADAPQRTAHHPPHAARQKRCHDTKRRRGPRAKSHHRSTLDFS